MTDFYISTSVTTLYWSLHPSFNQCPLPLPFCSSSTKQSLPPTSPPLPYYVNFPVVRVVIRLTYGPKIEHQLTGTKRTLFSFRFLSYLSRVGVDLCRITSTTKLEKQDPTIHLTTIIPKIKSTNLWTREKSNNDLSNKIETGLNVSNPSEWQRWV